MDFEQIQINNFDELVKLPWFEIGEDGKMRIKPGSGVPPIFDTHTHLGWSYFAGRVIKYQQTFPKTRQYYDFDNLPVNLERNDHPTKKEGTALTVDIVFTPVRCSPWAWTQTAANLLEEMERFNGLASIVLPIELPIRSRHAYQCVINCKEHERLIVFAAVHPWTRYKKLRLDWQTRQGALGLKCHPEFQFCPPDTKGALELFGMCEERGLPVLGHSGSTGTEPAWMQKLSAPEKYVPALKAFPKLQLILGHTAIRYYEQAIEIAKQFPEQVWLETSGQGYPVIRKILNEYDRKRVLHGSDWTFFPLAVPLARALVSLEGYPQEVIEDYFFRNACRLLGFDPEQAAQRRLVRNA